MPDLPLISLRTFRVAAKHQSFTLAAAHLSVTQSAVSHHIKILEKHLNFKLFERHGKQLKLTNEGCILYQTVEKCFTNLANTIERMSANKARHRVILGVLSSFATKWLVPRLGSFYRNHSDVELVVRSTNHTIDVERENFDLAIINVPAPPSSKHVKSTLICRERLFAVCSPQYAAKSTLKTLHDLGQHTLLHDETEIAAERGFDWLSWLQHFKVESVMHSCSSQYFSQSDLALQAAIIGHGIALTHTSISANDLKNGLLINPFPGSDMATQSACYLCGQKEGWNNEGNRLLREWLLAETAADEAFYKKL